MKTINNITGIAVEAPTPDLHCGFALCDEPAPGFIRQLRMGITGMVISVGETQLFIPASAFWALAESSDAVFKAPTVVPGAKPSRRSGQ